MHAFPQPLEQHLSPLGQDQSPVQASIQSPKVPARGAGHVPGRVHFGGLAVHATHFKFTLQTPVSASLAPLLHVLPHFVHALLATQTPQTQ